MLKHAALLLGLGLAISLTACEKATSSAPAPAKTSSSDTPKTKPTRVKKTGETPKTGDGEGRPQKRQPSKAAFAACESLAVKASCSFETQRGARTGTCRKRKDEDGLVCVTARPKGAGAGRPEGQRPPRASEE